MAMKLQPYRELDESDLQRIQWRAEAATAGPWYSYVVGRDVEAAGETSRIELGWCNELGSFKSMELVGATVADQDFIANAREDVPRLLLEVRILRARLEALRDTDTRTRRPSRSGVLNGVAVPDPA
jgi:hypothetical protein